MHNCSSCFMKELMTGTIIFSAKANLSFIKVIFLTGWPRLTIYGAGNELEPEILITWEPKMLRSNEIESQTPVIWWIRNLEDVEAYKIAQKTVCGGIEAWGNKIQVSHYLTCLLVWYAHCWESRWGGQKLHRMQTCLEGWLLREPGLHDILKCLNRTFWFLWNNILWHKNILLENFWPILVILLSSDAFELM